MLPSSCQGITVSRFPKMVGSEQHIQQTRKQEPITCHGKEFVIYPHNSLHSEMLCTTHQGRGGGGFTLSVPHTRPT